MAKNDNVEFVGCDLHYHVDKPGFDKDPSTLESQTPRPVSINGKRQMVIDMHAHCQLSNIWPLIEGREELGGANPFESQLKENRKYRRSPRPHVCHGHRYGSAEHRHRTAFPLGGI